MHPTPARQPRRVIAFWENLHPLARTNLAILLVATLAWLVLYGLVYAGPRLLSFKQVFDLATVRQLWQITSLVLLAVLFFNAARLTVYLARRQTSSTSASLAWSVIIGVALLTLSLPSFFEGAVSYAMGQPYSRVFEAYRALCDEWDARYPPNDVITLHLDEEDLGLFENHPGVTLRRERKVVFFDFGDEEQPFGLVCALGGDPPHTGGRAADYDYEAIDRHFYRYIERKANP